MAPSPRSRHLRTALTFSVIGFVGVVAWITLVTNSANTVGERWAVYEPIDTPAEVSRANARLAALVGESLGGVILPIHEESQTMVEDAGDKPIGGGQQHRETDYDAVILLGKPPFVVPIHVWGWGTPSGAYRADVIRYAPVRTTTDALPPSAVEGDRARLSRTYRSILGALDMTDSYDVDQLARDSVIDQYADGGGITIAGALLPPRSSNEETGALVVLMSGDWELDSLYVNTDDDDFYYDVVNRSF